MTGLLFDLLHPLPRWEKWRNLRCCQPSKQLLDEVGASSSNLHLHLLTHALDKVIFL